MMWRPVYGWKGLYEVSSDGIVRSIARRCINARGNGTYLRPGRVIKPQMSAGYLRVRLTWRGHSDNQFVHVLVLEAFASPRPAGLVARHLDGDATNNRADNLAWGTQAQNCADKARHGTAQVGERNPAAKLTSDGAHAVREAAALGEPGASIARRLGMAKSSIYAILRNETWTTTLETR